MTRIETKFQPLVESSLAKEKRYQSVLVGIVTPSGTEVFPFGTVSDKGSAPTSSTIFEIGSITKGFLGLLLAQESLHKKLNLDGPYALESVSSSRRAWPVFMNGSPVEAWRWKDASVLQGAGALRSSMRDMLVFLKAMMGIIAKGLAPKSFESVVAEATEPTFQEGKNSQIGLFWNHLKAENIIWHNGGTYGSTSFVGYHPTKRVGIVVLSNSMIIDEKGVDSRIDLSSIKTLLEVAASL